MIENSPIRYVTVDTPSSQDNKVLQKTEVPEYPITTKRITILFTGDNHSFLEPSKNSNSVLREYGSELGGIIRRINCISQIMQNEPVLVLDAGDFLTGTSLFDVYQGRSDVEMMNLTNYHIVTIGNHDLDKGWSHLKSLLENARFKAVCANVCESDSNALILPAWTILDIQGFKVAVVGLMGKDAWSSISPSKRIGLQLKDPDNVLENILPQLHSKVDKIILLSHSGILADREFAKKHPHIDLIIGGHSHTYMKYAEEEMSSANKITPIFHAYKHGQFLGHVTIEVDSKTRKTTYGTSLLPMDSKWDMRQPVSSLLKIQELLDSYLTETKGFYSQVIGKCVKSLPKDNISTELVPLGNNLCDIFRLATQSTIAIYPSNGIRKGFEEGDITLREISEMLPLESLFTIEVSGSWLRQLMKKGEERWPTGRQTFQYAGISLNQDSSILVENEILQDDKFYTVTSCSFFFEREGALLPNRQVNPELLNSQIKAEIVEHSESTHKTVHQWIETYGIGNWVRPL